MKHFIYCCLVVLCALFGQTAMAQSFVASGSVYDSTHEPLVGASVKVVGTTQGATTGQNGQFSVNCKENATLEISYIGYKTASVKAGKDLVVVLEDDANLLDEAVIVGVGYGKMRKSDLTGAISSVNAKDLKQGVITSAEQLLQGKVAGLAVTQSSGSAEAGATLRLRGGTSLSASNGPLVVVDGIPGVDFNSVQPSEIVSIDVLKDASAAAIYGSRGANGVIIVTTNRQATDVEHTTMQYNGYVAVSNVAKQLDILSANQWRQYVRDNNVLNALDFGADTDWQNEILRTAISHSHNFNFSSSRKNSGYRAALTYQNNEGVVRTNSLDRLAGSLSAYQFGLNGRLRFEEGINANFDRWHSIDTRIFERTLNLNPTFPVTNPDGSYAQLGGTNTENPVEIMNNRTDDRKRHRFLGYAKAELEIIDGLTATVNTSYEYNSTTTGLYKPTYAMMEGASTNGWAQRTFAEYTNKQLEAYLTYDKHFGDAHHLNVMAGYSYLDNMYEGFGSTRQGFTTNAFGYNNLAAGTDFQQGDVYSYKGSTRLISFFGRANYSLLGRYMLTVTMRHDGSSVFGADHKWGDFPSVSAAWRISEESFMEGTRDWLDNLKLRVGFGITGNQNGIGAYQSLPVLSASGAAYYDPASGSWLNSYTQKQNVNPDLKWEQTAQTNVGIDFGFIGRIHGTLEFYNKQTSDLLWTYPVPQPPYIVGTMLANVGNLRNTGVELSLGANILRTKDWTLDINASAAYNDQEITKLSNDKYTATALQAGSVHNIRGLSNIYTQTIREGYPAGAFWGPVCEGIDDNGEFILKRDGNGEVVEEYLGSALPKWNVGLAINATYRNFDLSVAGYGAFGQKVLNATRMQLFDASRLPAQNTLDDFLTSGIRGAQQYSSYYVEDAGFFRLQSITLGYTIPGVKRAGFGSIRVYATAENLFCLTGYSGTDPEVYIPDNVSDGQGIDRLVNDNISGNGGTYSPRPRTFSFGVNVTF